MKRVTKKMREFAKNWGEDSWWFKPNDDDEEQLRIRMLVEYLAFGKHRITRGAQVKHWRKRHRQDVLDRKKEFPNETNREIADFLVTNHDILKGANITIETVEKFVSDVLNGGVGFGERNRHIPKLALPYK